MPSSRRPTDEEIASRFGVEIGTEDFVIARMVSDMKPSEKYPECEDCGAKVPFSRYFTGAGEPLCESCWDERHGEGGIFADDDEYDDALDDDGFKLWGQR